MERTDSATDKLFKQQDINTEILTRVTTNMPKEVGTAVRNATSKVSAMVKQQMDSISNMPVPPEGLVGCISKPGGGHYFLKALGEKANDIDV